MITVLPGSGAFVAPEEHSFWFGQPWHADVFPAWSLVVPGQSVRFYHRQNLLYQVISNGWGTCFSSSGFSSTHFNLFHFQIQNFMIDLMDKKQTSKRLSSSLIFQSVYLSRTSNTHIDARACACFYIRNNVMSWCSSQSWVNCDTQLDERPRVSFCLKDLYKTTELNMSNIRRL